jgi:RHS repeat-associated protein
LSQAPNPANNRLVGYNYDANGNQQEAPGFYGTPTYDAENRMITAPGVQYAYDSQNKRVWAATVNSSNGLTGQTVNFYGVNGQKIGSYTLYVNYGAGQYLEFSDAPANLEIYFGSKRVGTTQNGATSSYWQDRLGSNRAGTYYPWGEDLGTPAPNDQVKFATYTRDSATLLDYADQRYYGNAQGRFMTPDQSTGGGGSSPETWNKYAYAGGDPVNFNDPRGTNPIPVFAPPPVSGCDEFETECGFGSGFQDSNGYCDPSQGPGFCGSPCVGADGTPAPSWSCQGTPPPVPVAGGPKPAPYLAALVLIGDCYDQSASAVGQAGGAAVDDLTYQAVDQYGNPYLGSATITETNTILSGNTTSINTSWTLSGGMFEDSISSGIQNSMQELESYFVAGSGTPLTINWFYGSQYAVLGVYATPIAVIINNTVPVNKNGTPHYCNQHNSIQSR